MIPLGEKKGLRPGLRVACACVLLAVLAMMIAPAGCSGSRTDASDGPGTYRISGTMHATHLEGGCWQFIADNGRTYELSGTELEPLLQDGIRAELAVRDTTGIASSCMTGKIVVVVRIISTSH